ncbi:hypothetical protein CsSME_00031549 [Camellia sinensis var. sinensis]|uniref:Uncharacterized protein n=1 Tax=Camellia sinensis var. sinensis TaxID=542762 RepID=A0A4S4E5R0_CAMSN|nr:hypothetical protein TEA_025809 [Camellia sinensis var. sinensis]
MDAFAENKDEKWRYIPLLHAALRGDWDSAKRIFDQDEAAFTANITDYEETALHVSVSSARSIDFVKKLVDLMPAEALELPNVYGMTALHNAAGIGNTKAATILVDKHPASLYISDNLNWLPLHWAADCGHKETLLYLLSVTKEDHPVSMPFACSSGAQLLSRVVASEFYGQSHLITSLPNFNTKQLNQKVIIRITLFKYYSQTSSINNLVISDP